MGAVHVALNLDNKNKMVRKGKFKIYLSNIIKLKKQQHVSMWKNTFNLNSAYMKIGLTKIIQYQD